MANTSIFQYHLPMLAFAGNVADRCCTDKYGFKVDLVDSLKKMNHHQRKAAIDNFVNVI